MSRSLFCVSVNSYITLTQVWISSDTLCMVLHWSDILLHTAEWYLLRPFVEAVHLFHKRPIKFFNKYFQKQECAFPLYGLR